MKQSCRETLVWIPGLPHYYLQIYFLNMYANNAENRGFEPESFRFERFIKDALINMATTECR